MVAWPNHSTKLFSICYVAPGHTLLSTSGASRNILSLANALSAWADVTLAFRTVHESIDTERFRLIAIEPQRRTLADPQDDGAIRGINPVPHLWYLHKLRRFARQWASSFDLVFEKGWRLSGFLATAFSHCGVPSVVIENDARFWSDTRRDMRGMARYMLHMGAQRLAGFFSRRAPLVIAETEALKTILIEQRGISPDRLEVAGLGVDHALFRPMDQRSARQALGLNPDAHILLYVGSMDMYHDLDPLLDALPHVVAPSLELHLVGDGLYRSQYETKARQAHQSVRFHHTVPHDMVPVYIAAADACLAPYREAAFHNQIVPFSTLKIPEYMACGRPVISVPSGHIQDLIEDQVSGFLFPNDVRAWISFFKVLPTPEHCKTMGRAAAQAVAALSWERTAARYLEVSQRILQGAVSGFG